MSVHEIKNNDRYPITQWHGEHCFFFLKMFLPSWLNRRIVADSLKYSSKVVPWEIET